MACELGECNSRGPRLAVGLMTIDFGIPLDQQSERKNDGSTLLSPEQFIESLKGFHPLYTQGPMIQHLPSCFNIRVIVSVRLVKLWMVPPLIGERFIPTASRFRLSMCGRGPRNRAWSPHLVSNPTCHHPRDDHGNVKISIVKGRPCS